MISSYDPKLTWVIECNLLMSLKERKKGGNQNFREFQTLKIANKFKFPAKFEQKLALDGNLRFLVTFNSATLAIDMLSFDDFFITKTYLDNGMDISTHNCKYIGWYSKRFQSMSQLFDNIISRLFIHDSDKHT